MPSYITLEELETLGINPKALGSTSDEARQAAIDAASDEVDRYVGGRVGVPLTEPIPLALKSHVARMAVFNLMSVRGMDAESDKLIVDNYNRAIAFLTQVSKGVVTLGPVIAPPVDDPSDDTEGPFLYSDLDRGYPRGWV